MTKYIIQKGDSNLYYTGKSEYRNIITGKGSGSGTYKFPMFNEKMNAKSYNTIAVAKFITWILNNEPFPRLTKLHVVKDNLI